MLAVAFVAITLVASATDVVDAASRLPSSFKRCPEDDPQLSECLRLAVEDAFHKMKDGVSSLGVLPVDPLKVEEIKIDQGEGPVSLKMDLNNITIRGLAKTKMVNYSADLDHGFLHTLSLTPSMRMDFDYEVNGRILVLPMRGKGPGFVILNDLTTDQHLKFIPTKKKDGKKYWSIQDYALKFDPKGISMHYDGLFGGDPRLGDQLNLFLNQNGRLIFNEIGGAFEEAFGAVFKEITSRVFSKVPLEDIFIPAKVKKASRN